MPVDESLIDLVARVGAFHITHRSMRVAQSAIESAVRAGDVPNDRRLEYLREVRRYFESFDREARAHLRDIDRRLERANQVHFNLTAERGVAVKRIEGTQSVLHALAAVEEGER